jgi:hypothetical protein
MAERDCECIAQYWLPNFNTEELRISIADEQSIFAIYELDIFGESPFNSKLSFMATCSGLVVWSKNITGFGAPYFAAEVKHDTLGKTIEYFDQIGVFENSANFIEHTGIGAPTGLILIKSESRVFKMLSWHESAEFLSKYATCNEDALKVSRKAKRYSILRTSNFNFLFSRLVWSEIRLHATKIVPVEGVAISGELSLSNLYYPELATFSYRRKVQGHTLNTPNQAGETTSDPGKPDE